MSERKSWDIQPNRRPQVQPQRVEPARAAPAPASLPPKRPRPIKIAAKPRAQAPEPIQIVRPIRREKVPQGKEREPLKERRKRARQRARVASSILLLLLIIGFFVVAWMPAFRIQHVKAEGTDAADIQTVAMQSLAGTTDYVFPKNSIFFFPQNALRTALLAKFPDISAVSISRTSFDAISISSISRETAFYWCGVTYGQENTGNTVEVVASTTAATATTSPEVTSTQQPETNCYDADSQGYVYAFVPVGTLSGDTLRVYAPLNNTNTASPLGARIAGAQYIPNELQFVKAIKSLGAPIVTLVLRGDEADLYTQSGTRITYVIGQEEMSAQLAQSAFPSLNLNDGSLEYVDLRFPGKVYYKPVNADAQVTSQQPSSH